jgi:hypothetical protein
MCTILLKTVKLSDGLSLAWFIDKIDLMNALPIMALRRQGGLELVFRLRLWDRGRGLPSEQLIKLSIL